MTEETARRNKAQKADQAALAEAAKILGCSVADLIEERERLKSLPDVYGAEIWDLSLDEQLRRVIEKLNRNEPLLPGELGWLIDNLESQRRPAHRPKKSVFMTERGWKAEAVWRRMRAGMSEKAAVGEAAEELGISESTLRRTCRDEQARIDRIRRERDSVLKELSAGHRSWAPLVRYFRSRLPSGKPEPKRAKRVAQKAP